MHKALAGVASLRRKTLGLSTREVSFARRGFCATESKARKTLEQSASMFLAGYHVALEEDLLEAVARRIDLIDIDVRGFAYEGAAMGLTVRDHLWPVGGHRLHTFLCGPGQAHAYMVHVGAGWAIAVLPWLRYRMERFRKSLDPLLGWLAIDGFGFHQGFFATRRTVEAQGIPSCVSGYARRAFDQGLGRSLWFVATASIPRLSEIVSRFPAYRQPDLWSGAGLACAYAGGVTAESVMQLREAAGGQLPHAAQGAAFAAKTRARAGNPTAYTDVACQILCGMSAQEAAALTDTTLSGLAGDGDTPAYERWRQKIQRAFAAETEL